MLGWLVGCFDLRFALRGLIERVLNKGEGRMGLDGFGLDWVGYYIGYGFRDGEVWVCVRSGLDWIGLVWDGLIIFINNVCDWCKCRMLDVGCIYWHWH